ncbi:hypothetical protein AUF12_03690 [Enterococcus avium]|nr:hypothetical protein AUF12_03690 [Enterococcus avium]
MFLKFLWNFGLFPKKLLLEHRLFGKRSYDKSFVTAPFFISFLSYYFLICAYLLIGYSDRTLTK